MSATEDRRFIAIDLKSFYASVECVARDRDPLTTHLVVADPTRTEKTICLAVTPSLKAYGISGRSRLFEVIAKMKEVNAARRRRAPGGVLSGSSDDDVALRENPSLEASFIVAPPRMNLYMEKSTQIYGIYLNYVSPEDVHVYSVDEVFIDATKYLRLYGVTARELALRMIKDVLSQTGITATVGIGTNLYLSKIAMDIVAKHADPDADGARIAELDEASYRRLMWTHRPLTDFWRVGHGYASRLEEEGIYTMGDVARVSLINEDKLYRMFGVNAELLIDHAWGYEPCEIRDIKEYRPENNSLSTGQVLKTPYTFDNARLVCREMADALSLDLVAKGLVTDQIVLTVCYDTANLSAGREYGGAVDTDRYGRRVPKDAHGSHNIGRMTSSTRLILDAVTEIYDRVVDPNLMVRRMYVVANHVKDERYATEGFEGEQLDLLTDYSALGKRREEEKKKREREKKKQKALIGIKRRYGKNAILKGMDFEEGATAIERNGQVGGHKA